jgi:hypothetical protein
MRACSARENLSVHASENGSGIASLKAALGASTGVSKRASMAALRAALACLWRADFWLRPLRRSSAAWARYAPDASAMASSINRISRTLSAYIAARPLQETPMRSLKKHRAALSGKWRSTANLSAVSGIGPRGSFFNAAAPRSGQNPCPWPMRREASATVAPCARRAAPQPAEEVAERVEI